MRKQLTIFYTDDDQEDRDFFIEMIDMIDSNIRVMTQKSGQELLKALENPPQTAYIVFLDINMPGMNGLDILKALRASDKHKATPVVMFSTSNDTSSIETSRALGASFYVAKPGALDKLKKSLEYTINIDWENFSPEKSEFVYSQS